VLQNRTNVDLKDKWRKLEEEDPKVERLRRMRDARTVKGGLV
jgi:hypothetical protein